MVTNDEELIKRIKNGDLDAFDELAAKYETKVYTIAYRFTGNYNDASDLAQDSLIRVYRSIHGFRGESSFSTWLYRVVTNVCKDEMRRRAKERTVSMDEMLEKGRSPEAGMRHELLEDFILHKEWQSEVQEVLDSLSEEHRTVVVLRDIQGYSYEEIAQFLECSLGTVKSRLNRARNMLKEKLLRRKELLSGRACQSY